MLSKIKLIEFRNNTEALREQALSGQNSRIPLMRDDDRLGIIPSMDRAADFLISAGDKLPHIQVRSFTAKQFYETVRPVAVEDLRAVMGDISIVALRQNKKSTGTVIPIVSETLWADRLAQFEPTGWGLTCSKTPPGARTCTNVDLATEFTRPWKTLQSEISSLALMARDGTVCYRRDGEIAILSPENALRLKEHVYNGRGDIIKDWRSQDFRENLQAASRSVTAREHFVRITGAPYSGSHDMQQLCTMVDGLSAEFLNVENGVVKGIEKRDMIQYSLPFDATICSDFNNVTKLRIDPASENQWALMKKALEQAKDAQHKISVQGVSMRFFRDAPETPDVRTTSNFSYSTSGRAQFCLTKNGDLLGLRLGFNDQKGLAAFSALAPKVLEVQRGGKGHTSSVLFSLERG